MDISFNGGVNIMLSRVLIGAGFFLFGYYVGKEVKRKESNDKHIQESGEDIIEESPSPLKEESFTTNDS